MTVSAFTRLLRVLDLEEKQSWRNRGVIGGLQAMGERWAKDAREEEANPQIVDIVLILMAHYETAAPTVRPEVAEKMRRAVSGDIEDFTVLLTAVVEGPIVVDDAWSAAADDGNDMAYEESFPPPEPTHIARERIRRQQVVTNRNPRDLQAAPTVLPGVGSATAEQLARLGINQVADLLWHLPARHEDFSQLRTIDKLQPGEQVTVVANLWDLKERKISMKREMVQGILADGTGRYTPLGGANMSAINSPSVLPCVLAARWDFTWGRKRSRIRFLKI